MTYGEGIAQTTNCVQAAKAVVVRKSLARKGVRVRIPPSAPWFVGQAQQPVLFCITAMLVQGMRVMVMPDEVASSGKPQPCYMLTAGKQCCILDWNQIDTTTEQVAEAVFDLKKRV